MTQQEAHSAWKNGNEGADSDMTQQKDVFFSGALVFKPN